MAAGDRAVILRIFDRAWSDSNSDGHYDTLSIETRAFRGPRSYDSSGIPFHKDNQTVVKERIALDKDNRNSLIDEITVADHALTRPWTVRRSYMRDRQPLWIEISCSDNDLQCGWATNSISRAATGA